MEELTRAQELRFDEVSVQKLRENHDAIQKLISQIQELQDRVNCTSDSGEFQWKKSHDPSQPAVIPGPRSMLSRDKRLPLGTWNLSEPRETFLAIHVL